MNFAMSLLKEMARKEEGASKEVLTDLYSLFDLTNLRNPTDPEKFQIALKNFIVKWMADDISVGDVCIYPRFPDRPFIISRIYWDDAFFFDAIYKDGEVLEDGTLRLVEKTGEYYPIERFLKGTFE